MNNNGGKIRINNWCQKEFHAILCLKVVRHFLLMELLLFIKLDIFSCFNFINTVEFNILYLYPIQKKPKIEKKCKLLIGKF